MYCKLDISSIQCSGTLEEKYLEEKYLEEKPLLR